MSADSPMPDPGPGASEIERILNGYRVLRSVSSDPRHFVSAFNVDAELAPARAELAALRAKAERAGDCEAIVRLVCSSADLAWECDVFCDAPTWSLRDEHDKIIDTGPIVDGLPVLTPKAREAIEKAVKS